MILQKSFFLIKQSVIEYFIFAGINTGINLHNNNIQVDTQINPYKLISPFVLTGFTCSVQLILYVNSLSKRGG